MEKNTLAQMEEKCFTKLLQEKRRDEIEEMFGMPKVKFGIWLAKTDNNEYIKIYFSYQIKCRKQANSLYRASIINIKDVF